MPFTIEIPQHLHHELAQLAHVKAPHTQGQPHTLAHDTFGGLAFKALHGNKVEVTVTDNPLHLPEELIKKRLEIDVEIYAHAHDAKHGRK